MVHKKTMKFSKSKTIYNTCTRKATIPPLYGVKHYQSNLVSYSVLLTNELEINMNIFADIFF